MLEERDKQREFTNGHYICVVSYRGSQYIWYHTLHQVYKHNLFVSSKIFSTNIYVIQNLTCHTHILYNSIMKYIESSHDTKYGLQIHVPKIMCQTCV